MVVAVPAVIGKVLGVQRVRVAEVGTMVTAAADDVRADDVDHRTADEGKVIGGEDYRGVLQQN